MQLVNHKTQMWNGESERNQRGLNQDQRKVETDSLVMPPR